MNNVAPARAHTTSACDEITFFLLALQIFVSIYLYLYRYVLRKLNGFLFNAHIEL